MRLTMQVQCQPDVYTEPKRYYLANNIFEKNLSNTQNILNIGTFKYEHAQVDLFEVGSMDGGRGGEMPVLQYS